MTAGHDRGSDNRAPKDSRYLSAALALLLVFMAAEVVVGILASSLALISDAAHMLTDAGAIALALVASRLAARLEAAPRGIDVSAIDADLHRMYSVVDIHDLHVWEVTSGFPTLSAHVLVERGADCHERRLAITALLAGRYGIDHTTLQVDHPAPQPVIPAEQLSRRSGTSQSTRRS